ncbi:UNVERIFIED_CONTAM: putative mitochondrial protein [Sesamum radiatum]|uniref:Mitochondrial protein n=1 Tax=Sesamum radiatum TaxID=300843 RepID=A0AAW2T503_SESRA
MENAFSTTDYVPSSCPLPLVPSDSIDFMHRPSENPSTTPIELTNPTSSLDHSPSGIQPHTVPTPSTTTTLNTPHLIRSLRQKHKPTWLNDFVSHSSTPSLLYSSNIAYMSFVASLSVLQEPRSFSDAVKHVEWRDTMNAELEALEQNNTWRLTPLPLRKRAIGCKWVYKTKLRADGSIDRYKARLVAKGFNQIEGVDYTDSFSPVAKTVTLSQFITCPCEGHWKAALHMVRYLKGCPSHGLFLPVQNSFVLKAYCDADWALCSDSRRSLTKAEYRSMAATVCELLWLSYILADLGISFPLPVELFCDNKAAIYITANPVFHERTKHIEMDCHIVRDAFKEGFILPTYVRSSL